MAKHKRIGMVIFGAVFCLLLVAPSFAATVNVGDYIQLSFAPGHPGSFNGGAFTATTDKGFSWYSFCIEKNEYIDFSTPYPFRVYDISGTAFKGGLGVSDPLTGVSPPANTGDPISSQTAFLYYKYATNQLGFTGPGDPNQQRALQNVFWYLENEISSVPSDTYGYGATYLDLAKTAEVGNYYGVAVVNISWPDGRLAQSQLVYVPEAGALLLFGTGLIGLVGYRRVRRMQ